MSNISAQWADGMELRIKEQAAQIAALTAERAALTKALLAFRSAGIDLGWGAHPKWFHLIQQCDEALAARTQVHKPAHQGTDTMSTTSRNLQPGDWAVTDYTPRGRFKDAKLTRVQIIERTEGRSQSGILFRVAPALPGNTADEWFDADWFEPDSAPSGAGG